MRVLFLVRRNLEQHPGGDTTQILRTAAALRALGAHVDLSGHPRPTLAGYDVIHLFHLDRIWENFPHCRRIRAAGRPAVLSPIYWPPDEFDRSGRAGLQGWLARRLGSRRYENVRLLERFMLHAAQERTWGVLCTARWDFNAAVRFLLETVAVLLPNSDAERRVIAGRFGVERPALVVPNAADPELFRPPVGEPPARAGVLCVGRLEPRKNQLRLIEALRGSGIPLTLVGQAGRFNRGYARKCRAAADGTVRFVSHQSPEGLRALYRAARVHACVSWYETPGLASLEAALCGCAIVVTPGGSTREYFREQAWYCDPADPASIRAAIERASASTAPAALAARLAEECTWQAAARQTYAAYRLALQSGCGAAARANPNPPEQS